ncbi:CocE/NonD family hydrolase [Aestuariivirga sp.]|uniref:CocE/NonD family hydrolase n=1 Tax=Aestuariivirga sp. TaxID=2650926 RepID=UPI003593D4B9
MPKIVTEFPHEVDIVENLFIPLRDGTKLAAKLWIPKSAEKEPVPALLEYLPYRKRDGTRGRDQGMHLYYAGHGYASIRVDIRGCGDSDGILPDEYTVQEQKDGCEVIAWLARQPWCSGRVAMFGNSWGGFNALQIAARQPPALKTIITVGSTDDRYATDIHWVGGCLSKDNFDWSSTMFAHQDLPPDPEIVGPRWREMWLERAKHNVPWILTWLKHQRRDGYWKQGSVCEDFSKIRIPVYAVNGWADNYSESIPRLLEGLNVPRKGLIGPWAHSYPQIAAVGPAIGWLQDSLRWYDHWLKDIDTGVMDEPMYRVWMQDGRPPSTCYAERPGRWVAESSWPSPRIRREKHYLNHAGALSKTRGKVSKLSICSPLTVGIAAGEVGRYGQDAEWPTDQREDDGGSLVFTSAPLTKTIEILGAPQLHITFSSDKPQALVAVRLNDVAPDRRSTRVTVGLLNLTHRDSHEHAEALVPGKTYTATVDLDDIAHVFAKGHRIAVSLSTTYWPIAWPSPELATLTLQTGKSRLDLPVRPTSAADGKLRPFEDPVSAPDTPAVHHAVEAKHRRSVRRDLLSGEIVVDFPRWTGSRTMTDIEQTHTTSGLSRYTITEGDPLSARTDTEFRIEIKRKDATLLHHSTGSLTCDAKYFHVDMTLRLEENGVPVFEREWHERIRRDMV